MHLVVYRCADVGDILWGSDAVRKPLQPGGSQWHHQRDSSVPAAARHTAPVRHHVPLLARGIKLYLFWLYLVSPPSVNHGGTFFSFSFSAPSTPSVHPPLFFFGGAAEASGSAIFLWAAGGNQETGRKFRITRTVEHIAVLQTVFLLLPWM